MRNKIIARLTITKKIRNITGKKNTTKNVLLFLVRCLNRHRFLLVHSRTSRFQCGVRFSYCTFAVRFRGTVSKTSVSYVARIKNC